MFTPATDQWDLLTMYFFPSVMEMFGFGSFVFLIQAKHMIMLRDSVIQDVIQFLEHCEGKCLCTQSWPFSENCCCCDTLSYFFCGSARFAEEG